MAVTLGSTGITFPDATTQTTAAAGGLSAATQAEMEAASSNTVAATPLNTKWNPGVAKVWIKCDPSGNIQASLNVTSITDGGTGNVTITIDTDFSSANYSVVPGVVWDGGNVVVILVSNNPSAGAFTLYVYKTNTLASNDPNYYTVACYGDQ